MRIAFTLDQELVQGRRYTPDRAAPLTDYLRQLDLAGTAAGVLVQPSFLGTENRYLLQCLAACPHRLRGIAVVDPSCDEAAMAAMSADHIVGLRLNVIDQDYGFVTEPAWQRLFGRAREHGWQIEIHAAGKEIPFLLAALWPSGANIVIDHFGRPDPAAGLKDAGVQAILAKAGSGRIFIKLTGPYRCRGRPELYAHAYLNALGAERLMWGSDWPWTQHHHSMTYAKTLGWLSDWLPDADIRRVVLEHTPRALFHFQAAAPCGG